MTVVGRGLDLVLALLGAAAWSLTAFFLVSRFVSPTAGGLLALGLFLSGLVYVINGQLQDARSRSLSAGHCPRCKHDITSEHRHRRWEPERRAWSAPSLSWECASCGFSHSETWACAACPAAD